MSACWELLRSEAFFLLLSNFTGLRLHYLCPADDDDDEDKDEGKEKEEEQGGVQDGVATGSSTESQSADTSREKGVFSLFRLYSCVYVCVCVYFFDLFVLQS